jgi:glycosyltransferase involved in cell wall biosynthesis
MRIAVIIPVYNHARYVGEAIESVLAQTRPPECLLCIDDGSKDDSLAVCQRYADRGVKARGRENRGAHNTINELVQWAADEGCDWVNILNSDDRFLPRKLELCAAAAEDAASGRRASLRPQSPAPAREGAGEVILQRVLDAGQLAHGCTVAAQRRHRAVQVRRVVVGKVHLRLG